MPPTVVSQGYELTVFFTYDDEADSQGFAAAYTTINASTGIASKGVRTSCTSKLTAYLSFFPCFCLDFFAEVLLLNLVIFVSNAM